MSEFQFDLHTHTIASGHGSTATITQMAMSAARKGLGCLGISDHGPATPGGGKPSYFRSLSLAPRKRMHISMRYGAEVSILDNHGKLDLPDQILRQLDYVIASQHSPAKKPGTVDENTTAYIEAMKHPSVKIIGHCDDTHYPVDYDALVQAAIKYRVFLEINNASLSPNGYRGDTRANNRTILNLCRHYHYPILLSSDSHGTEHVGDFVYAMELIRQENFPRELILNHQMPAWLQSPK